MRTLTASLAALMLLAVGFAADTARAQNLPSCPGAYSNQWNNCVGTHMYANGDKFVGAFRNDKVSGLGTLYAANGTVLKEGQWENNVLIRSVGVAPDSAKSQDRRIRQLEQEDRDRREADAREERRRRSCVAMNGIWQFGRCQR